MLHPRSERRSGSWAARSRAGLSKWAFRKAGISERSGSLRLAHLDYGDDRAILLEGGEEPARVEGLPHGALRRSFAEQRLRCHLPLSPAP